MSKEEDVKAAQAALEAALAEPADDVQAAVDVVVEADVPADIAWLDIVLLDKRRPYGTVMPAEGVKRYFQDGKYFDHYGELVKE